MRGKGDPGSGERTPAGITPAYAGKRLRSAPQAYSMRDHPRVCGEKPEGIQASERGEGSPPRMRGKVDLLAVLSPPALDHPRVCGEKW